MTDNSGQAAPGWYPDPSGAPRQRYFDGEIWTEHYHDDAGVAGSPLGAAGGGMAMAGATQQALDPIGYWKKVVLENYVNFSGRARRAEYWWTYLINIVILIVLFIIGGIIGDAGIILPLLFGLAIILPTLGVMVRRLHDTGKSGWYYFISLIPFVGGIILLVFLATDGEKGPNQYGPSPKY